LSYLWVEDNKNIEGYELLKTALDGGSPLNNIRVIGFDRTGDATDITFLMTLANGNYHGIDAEGNNDDSGYPIIEGKLHIVGSASGKDRDFLFDKFPALVLTADKFVNFIEFQDPEVLRVLLANGVDKDDDGGITEEEAAAVTSIGTWFKDNTVIETFDEFEKFTGVTSFGDMVNHSGKSFASFNNCLNLKSISLPQSLTGIGIYAFQGCNNLTTIKWSDSLKEIRYWAFYGCSSLDLDIDLPNLEAIGDAAFWGTAIRKVLNLGKITSLPSSKWNEGCFYGCQSLRAVLLPETLKELGMATFRDCNSLNDINLPSSITKVGDSSFYNCTSLAIDDLSLPNLESLSKSAFYGVKINKISNLGKITSIPQHTNDSCPGTFGDPNWLEELILPDTLVSIGSRGLMKYTALKYLNIPSSVTSLGTNACHSCSSLEYIVVKNDTPPSYGSGAFTKTNDCPIYVPDASVTAYKEASGWSSYAARIKPLSEYTE
jgi:hypothetical protein